MVNWRVTVAIFYASMYGDTENAANILAAGLAEGGIKNIALYDVSVTDVSVLIAEAFRCSHLVFAAPTYNNGVYPAMYNFLHDMGALSLQNRTIGARKKCRVWEPRQRVSPSLTVRVRPVKSRS